MIRKTSHLLSLSKEILQLSM